MMSLYLFDHGSYGRASTLEMTCSRRRIRIWVVQPIWASFGNIPAKLAQGLTFAKISLTFIRDLGMFDHIFPKSGIFRPICKNQTYLFLQKGFLDTSTTKMITYSLLIWWWENFCWCAHIRHTFSLEDIGEFGQYWPICEIRDLTNVPFGCRTKIFSVRQPDRMPNTLL